VPGPEQCVCGQCGQPTTVMGYEESEQLEVEPAKYFVLVSPTGKAHLVRAVREGGSFGASAGAHYRQRFGQ